MTTSSPAERLSITLTNSTRIISSPDSRVLELSTPGSGRSPVNDEVIWSRLQKAGFDEESIKRRDKAALIAYIAKLESEIFDYQHQMGLLLIEKRDWSSKYEQVRASGDSTEMKYKHDQAAQLSALAEARKREENLKKSLAIEKECLANIEKTLHEMRAESAEAKVTAENKMAEAHRVLENAQKKFAEAEARMQAAESLQNEASRHHRIAERKLKEVEEREDDLRRLTMGFKTDCDEKEKQINLERQSLCERQKLLQQEQERLIDGQALLNQREEHINGKLQDLRRLEKASEDAKFKFEKELNVLNEGKAGLKAKLDSLSAREEAVSRREAMLDKKEAQLLCAQEKLASKERNEIQRLVAEQEAALAITKLELEAEVDRKRVAMQDSIENKRRDCELREIDLHQREELMREKEQELEAQWKALLEKEKDVTERLNLLQEKEENLCATKEARELEKIYMQKEKEEIKNMKVELQRSIDYLENKQKEVEEVQKKLEATNHERDELQVFEARLKDEIDCIRAQKLELMTEVEDLKAEKSKFETEWELIDEKRDELRLETERISAEKRAVAQFLKDERDRLNAEKYALREQFKKDLESLTRDREEFVSKMEQKHSDWFSKIQLERANFVQDIELQKIELENRIRKRRDEIESYLKEKEEAFEQERTMELQTISYQKEMLAKERENIESEMKRLENERVETAMDRERREKELAEIKMTVEKLQIQKEKLKEQRELLHQEREMIDVQIQKLSQLESLKVASEIVPSEMEEANKSTKQNLSAKRHVAMQSVPRDGDKEQLMSRDAPNEWFSPTVFPKQAQDSASSPSSAPFSWLKRCTDIIFKVSPEKSSSNRKVEPLENEYEGAKLLEDKYSQLNKEVLLSQRENVENKPDMVEKQISNGKERTGYIFGRVQPVKSVSEEPKVILEVSADENLEKTNNLESESETDNTENMLHPDQVRTGRKRGNSYPKNYEKKKRRQGKDPTETFLDETTNNCAVYISTEENGFTTLDQISRGNARNGSSVEDNQRPLGDTSRSNGTETNIVSVKLNCSQNFSLASDQNDLVVKGIDAKSCHHRVGNAAVL